MYKYGSLFSSGTICLVVPLDILFRSTKIHLFPVVVLGMSQAIAWLYQMVEYQELFSMNTKFLLGMLLPCFAFLVLRCQVICFGEGMHFAILAILPL